MLIILFIKLVVSIIGYSLDRTHVKSEHRGFSKAYIICKFCATGIYYNITNIIIFEFWILKLLFLIGQTIY